jgi:hypothetical protein
VPTYRITAPNGRVFRVTGEGSKEEALAHIQSQYEKPKPTKQSLKESNPAEYDPSSQAYKDKYGSSSVGGEFRPLGIDTGIQTPKWLDRGLSGVGKAFTDTQQGLGQLETRGYMPSMSEDQRALASQGMAQQTQDKRDIDSQLMDTTAGKVGNLAGNVAIAAPTLALPGANTVTGAGLIGAGLGAVQPAASDQERLVNTGIGGGLGAAGQGLGNLVANKAASSLANRQASAQLAQAQNAPRDAVLRESMEAGFAVPPATTNPSALNTALESIAGKAATQSAASRANQQVTNTLIRRDLGIAEDAPLTPETLKKVRSEAGKAYEAIKETGDVIADEKFLDDVIEIVGDSTEINKNFPGAKVSAGQEVTDLADSLLQEKFTASSAIEYVKRLRSQAKTNFKAFDNPEKLQLARAQWEAAGALEDVIGRNLQQKGLGDLVEQFQKARVAIAKSHSAEAALNEGTGNIVASKLVTQLRKGKPLSGGFEQIAKFASAAPKAMKEPTESGGVSALNAAIAAGGIGFGQPGIIAIPVARLLTRRAILKQGMQRRIAIPNYTPGATGTRALQASRGLGRVGGPLAASVYAAQQ